MKKAKVTIRKFNGDDNYSWAVFRAKDIKGIKGIIMPGQARPLVTGCSKQDAISYKKTIENLKT